jgi:hypothetical protein
MTKLRFMWHAGEDKVIKQAENESDFFSLYHGDTEAVTFADFHEFAPKDVYVILTKVLKLNANPNAKKKIPCYHATPNLPIASAILSLADRPILFARVRLRKFNIANDDLEYEESDFAQHNVPVGMWRSKKKQPKNDNKVKKEGLPRYALC